MATSSDDVRALFRQLEEAMNARELDRLDDVIAPNFVRHCQATAQLVVNTRADFVEFLRQDAAMFPDNVQTFKHVVVDGDMAGFWATYEGTQKGQMGPFPPSGKRASFDFAGVARIEDGKFAEWWITWDNMTILGQLGHLPTE